MEKNLMRQHVLSLVLVACLLTGCGSFDKVGSNLARGVRSESDSIGYHLADGLETRLTGSATQQHVKHLLDSITLQIAALRDSVMNDKAGIWLDNLVEKATGAATKTRLASLRNELLGEPTQARLAAIREELVGYVTRTKLAALREELIGEQANAQIQRILLESRNNILSVETNEKLGLVREALLGEKTKNLIAAIVDTAMLNISYRLRENINPGLQENASFIKKYATELLITIALLAIGIIAFVWYSRRKYLKTVTLLTAQIQAIPNQEVYDDLTARIKENAVKAGVEPTLRKVLAENGLIGQENWESMKRKRAVMS